MAARRAAAALPEPEPGPVDIRLARATFLSGKGLSLAGGFLQAVIKSSDSVSLVRDDTLNMLRVIESREDGTRRIVEIPLTAVALEYEVTGG
jgi:hypothetical protein